MSELTSSNEQFDAARCAECGMTLLHVGEYHPYAACAMFKQWHDSHAVRVNLRAIMEHGRGAYETRALQDESGWLIELSLKGAPHWLAVSSVREWTADANKAVRFAREQDADAMLYFMGLEGAKATGHTWVDVRPAPNGSEHL